MKEGFKTIAEILEEVGEEEGFSKREMRDIWKHQESYVKSLMEEKEVYAISLPYIGTLSFNVKQFKKEIITRSKKVHAKTIAKAKALQNMPNYNFYENSHKRVTGVNRLARYIISKYNTGVENTKRIIRHKKCWEIITKYSNGVYQNKE